MHLTAPSTSRLTMGAGEHWQQTDRRLPPSEPWMSWCEWLLSHMFPLKASTKCFEFDMSFVRFLMGVLLHGETGPVMHWLKATL